MPNFFVYIDANGQRQGPINNQQLRKLVTQGIITPQTQLETDSGHKGFAGQIKGLFDVAQPSLEVPAAIPIPSPQAGQHPAYKIGRWVRKNPASLLVLIGIIGIGFLFLAFLVNSPMSERQRLQLENEIRIAEKESQERVKRIQSESNERIISKLDDELSKIYSELSDIERDMRRHSDDPLKMSILKYRRDGLNTQKWSKESRVRELRGW